MFLPERVGLSAVFGGKIFDLLFVIGGRFRQFRSEPVFLGVQFPDLPGKIGGIHLSIPALLPEKIDEVAFFPHQRIALMA